KSGPLQILAMPWVTRHGLLTKDDLARSSMLDIEMMLLGRVESCLAARAEELDPNNTAVLTRPGSIDGATVGGERSSMLGRDMILPKSMVALPNIDYVALGHIHKHQVLSQHPPVVYSGSIERIDFGEEQEDKGCVLVELERGAARWRFHKLAARPFVTLSIDVRTTAEPQARVADVISKKQLGGAIVRVLIEASPDQAGAIRVSEIQQQLEAANVSHVATITIDIERVGRSRLGAAAAELLEGLTPRRALELYLRQKNTPAERIAELLAAADELLAEQAAAG
ncbi:MAG: exonuclease SbcCD subunit D, partial [Roseiflexaceae bacterium]|nr:exonuclease SbcCD subunit D [Roseiflexaceae bacterium]